MENNIEIHWQQAQEFPERKRIQQAAALNEFRTSYCDLFNIQDWLHYSNLTGWSIEKLRAYARYEKQDQLTNILYTMLGSEIDEDDLSALGF